MASADIAAVLVAAVFARIVGIVVITRTAAFIAIAVAVAAIFALSAAR